MSVYRSLPSEVAVHETGWAGVPGTGVEVTKLPLIDTKHALADGTPLFARLTYNDAAKVAAALGARLIKPHRIDDLRKPGVAVQLTPYLGTPIAETDIIHSELHDFDVWRQLRALNWDGTKPVVGAGKHWVHGAPPGRSRLEGWDRDGAGPGLALWQPDMVAHNRQHFDDGTTTVLERDVGVVVPKPVPSSPRPVARPAQAELMRGDRGEQVKRLQGFLLALGYDLGHWGADGDFGKATEDAVKKFQADHGMAIDGMADEAVLAALKDAKPPDTLPTAYEFIAARNFIHGRKAGIDLVVLHSTENPIAIGAARNVARYFNSSNAPQASAHYVVGPEAVVQCVHEEDTAWAAPGANHNGVQVEQVGQAQFTDWKRDGADPRAGLAVLKRSAALVADICERYGIPVERVDAADLLLGGKRGITTHASVSAAFKRSDHADPGLVGDRRWPWDAFLAAVRGQ